MAAIVGNKNGDRMFIMGTFDKPVAVSLILMGSNRMDKLVGDDTSILVVPFVMTFVVNDPVDKLVVGDPLTFVPSGLGLELLFSTF